MLLINLVSSSLLWKVWPFPCIASFTRSPHCTVLPLPSLEPCKTHSKVKLVRVTLILWSMHTEAGIYDSSLVKCTYCFRKMDSFAFSALHFRDFSSSIAASAWVVEQPYSLTVKVLCGSSHVPAPNWAPHHSQLIVFHLDSILVIYVMLSTEPTCPRLLSSRKRDKMSEFIAPWDC